MGIYARITATDATKITVHRFGAALRQFAAGELTRAQIIAAFSLAGSDVTELDALTATYTGMGTGNAAAAFAKAAWLDRMEDVFILVETGDYLEAKAKSALGF
jgi:hypothetical protein